MCLPGFSSIFPPALDLDFFIWFSWVSLALLLYPLLPHSGHTTYRLDYFHRLQDHFFKSTPLSHLLPPTSIHPGYASSLNFLKQSLWSWYSLLWDCNSHLLLCGLPLTSFSSSLTHSSERKLCAFLHTCMVISCLHAFAPAVTPPMSLCSDIHL